jgi:hypothetical protein
MRQLHFQKGKLQRPRMKLQGQKGKQQEAYNEATRSEREAGKALKRVTRLRMKLQGRKGKQKT